MLLKSIAATAMAWGMPQAGLLYSPEWIDEADLTRVSAMTGGLLQPQSYSPRCRNVRGAPRNSLVGLQTHGRTNAALIPRPEKVASFGQIKRDNAGLAGYRGAAPCLPIGGPYCASRPANATDNVTPIRA